MPSWLTTYEEKVRFLTHVTYKNKFMIDQMLKYKNENMKKLEENTSEYVCFIRHRECLHQHDETKIYRRKIHPLTLRKIKEISHCI